MSQQQQLIVYIPQLCQTLISNEEVYIPPKYIYIYIYIYISLKISKVNMNVDSSNFQEKLYSPHGGPRHLCIIPLKNSHLIKIVKSVISFCLKNFHLNNFKQV